MKYLSRTASRFLLGRTSLRLLAALALLAATATMCVAELKGPSLTDRQVTLAITSLMRKAHLTRQRLDDQMSQRWFDSYLKSLDPMKVYFYQSDVDTFRRQATELDNMANRGDISFAYTVFNTYLQRVEERSKLAEQLLKENFDFSVDEEMTSSIKVATYPRSAAEAYDMWRKRIKFDLLIQKYDGLTDQAAREKLTRRYRSIAKRMAQTSSDEVLEMYLTAMTTSFDPHTTYMSPETLDNFRISMSLQLDGIGAALKQEDGQTIVSEVVPGGAASLDGRLKSQDRVVGVGEGANGEVEDCEDMKLSDIVKRIRGKAGTVVRIQVVPAAGGEKKIYNIVRAKIELQGSEARGEILEAGQKPDGTPYKIGVINLPSFYMDMVGAQRGDADFKSTTRDVMKILEDPKDGFQAKGVDAVILDLRNNGGGSLSEAIKLTGLFIPDGPVVQVKDWEGTIEQHDDTDPMMHWRGPLVVLTSRFSASASEIFAGAIQDYNRGLIIGDHSTHGKGTVQSLLDIGETLQPGPNTPNLGALKLTMQQFYRPNGHSTQKEGVNADVELPSLFSQMDIGEEHLDFAVAFDKIPAATFRNLGYVNDTIRKQLRILSGQRVAQNEEFQKVMSDIEKYLKRKDRTAVSLNEAKFKADRDELQTDKAVEEQEEKSSYDRPVVERNYYFEEALQVTLDYLKMMSVAKAQ